jgi:hypothetical protein
MKHLLYIFTLLPFFSLGQNSISKNDIEIYTQITLIEVDSKDINTFKQNLEILSNIAKQAEFNENYDWLTYQSDSDEFLIITFSDSIQGLLTLDHFEKQFISIREDVAFKNSMRNFNKLGINIKSNFIQEMILPWSTISEMSVTEFPLAEMVEYSYSLKKISEIDSILRKITRLLKETNYPYPLEGNRGSIGAYSKLILVWFLDNFQAYRNEKSIKTWLTKIGRYKEYLDLSARLDELTTHKKVYRLTYIEKLSN